MTGKVQQSQDSIFELRNHIRFKNAYELSHKLGAGGDGTVNLWQHKRSGKLIAVKTPNRNNTSLPDPQLMKEAKNLEILGKHLHVVEMLTYSETYMPRGPAIFLEYAPLGDLDNFEAQLRVQQVKHNKPDQIPEATVCKLLRDMSLALDFMHNKGFVHTDVKPDNILVFSPDGWIGKGELPVIPVFKLTDFSRMIPCPLTQGAAKAGPKHPGGTPEFSPPPSERDPLRPSGDMWSLGCTIQYFALGILPTQSKEAFIVDRKKAGKNYPALDDRRTWDTARWRMAVPNMYRPLNVTKAELEWEWDVPTSQGAVHIKTPYSTYLNKWYQALWDIDEKTRIATKALVEHFVCMVDIDIEIAELERLAEASFKTAKALREKVASRQLAS